MMREAILPEHSGAEKDDSILLVTVILLAGLGMAVLFSASFYRAQVVFGDSLHFIKRQVLWMVLGVAGAVVLSRVSLSRIERAVPLVVFGGMVMLLLTFIPGLAPPVLGSQRWLVLGPLSVQPSEFVKLGMVVYLASILAKKQDRLDDVVNSLLPPMIIVIVCAVLVYLQNDFSTAIFLIALALVMFFAAGVRIRHFILFFVISLPPTALLLLTKEYRVRRLLSFLVPELDREGSGYQILAARSALANGGFWGLGLGQGKKKLGGLPEAHSDFIFAVLGEELGYLGVLLVISLFAVFGYRGLMVARDGSGLFARYLAYGATMMIVMQAFMNMAEVAGITPSSGITLPFFSAGGSSSLVTFLACGLLFNVARVRKGVQHA